MNPCRRFTPTCAGGHAAHDQADVLDGRQSEPGQHRPRLGRGRRAGFVRRRDARAQARAANAIDRLALRVDARDVDDHGLLGRRPRRALPRDRHLRLAPRRRLRGALLFASALARGSASSYVDASADAMCGDAPRHVVIVDAGSTGCRAHTFEIVPGAAKPRFQLRAIGKKVKGHTPLASLAGVGDDAVANAIVPMLEQALAKVPADERSATPLYLWATAGVRVLSDEEQSSRWASVARVVSRRTRFRLGLDGGGLRVEREIALSDNRRRGRRVLRVARREPALGTGHDLRGRAGRGGGAADRGRAGRGRRGSAISLLRCRAPKYHPGPLRIEVGDDEAKGVRPLVA